MVLDLGTEETLPFHSPEFAEAWNAWVEDRKERRKKITERAKKLQWRELREMGEDRAIAAIYHSIKKGYQGIFEPKHNGQNHGSSTEKSEFGF
ncbi:hypothetical protein [Verrucomicrobium sp. BvORR106]|uniref:hypothetical protein n=1 Tax=Verrucomicrobium sp. BvORR106 TaxID=1403819 RepID=UPI00056DBFE5|nr:hypothetical protein [Verrucomicrobium sp. BvORR106]